MKDLNNANEETGEFREEAVKLIRKLQAEIRDFREALQNLLADHPGGLTGKKSDAMIQAEHILSVTRCAAGCKAYTGNEMYHHKDCPHYPESFSRRFDDLQAENTKLKTFAQFVISSITDTQNAGYTLTCPPKYLRRGAAKALEAKQ